MRFYKVLIFVYLNIFVFTACYSAPLLNDLIQAYDSCTEMMLELKELKYQRRDALFEFLKKYAGQTYITNNAGNLFILAGKESLTNKLNEILEPYVPDKKERLKLARSFSWPSVSSYKFKTLSQNLLQMLNDLRWPTDKGYKYAAYSKTQIESIEKQQLVAHHEIGQFQNYSKSFDKPLARVHIYSPSKNGLFSSNRDVYLETLKISYRVSGEEKNTGKVFKRYLKRGESLDFDLPEVAHSATINLTFATKKSHKGKAIFIVEPMMACLVDKDDSPFAGLVTRIKNAVFSSDSVDALQNQLILLKNSIKDTMQKQSGALNAGSEKNELQTAKTGMNSTNDNIRYFYYLLLDKQNDRDLLTRKFRQLFEP